MSRVVVYEIARFDGYGSDAQQLELLRLLSSSGVLKLRDESGAETPCEGSDVVAAISSAPALREIRDEQEARITCMPEIIGRLPFVLEPVIGGDDAENLSAVVNDTQWSAFRTDDESWAMLPGSLDFGPDMNPCWAEFQVGEGEYNPLIGWTSIGIAVPGVAVEYARYDHGGWGPVSAVAIRPFDDFATVFVDWLLGIPVLRGLWGGDSSPNSPSKALFETAANAIDRKGSWSTAADDDDESDEDDDDEDVYYEVDNSGWMHLQLHLSDPLIAEVRERINKPRKQSR